MSSPASKRPRSRSPPSSPPAIYASPAITDRKSTFLALYSPTLSVAALRADPRLRTADHRIAAWRRPSSTQQPLHAAAPPPLDVDHDDDGEARAGRRVAAVLAAQQVHGVCVVGRWWGGVMLGPARFTHIESVARGAVAAWQGAEHRRQGDGVAKRARGEADVSERARLLEELPKRDQSIVVLRQLLADKRAVLKGEGLGTDGNAVAAEEKGKGREVSGEGAATAEGDAKATALQGDEKRAVTPEAKAPEVPEVRSPTGTVAYGEMPLDALRRLETMRDRTIGFVLAEIEKAEAEIEGRTGVVQEDGDELQDAELDAAFSRLEKEAVEATTPGRSRQADERAPS